MEFLRFAGLALAITQRAVPGANRAAASDLGGLEDWSLAVDKLKVPTVTVEIIAPLWLTSSPAQLCSWTRFGCGVGS